MNYLSKVGLRPIMLSLAFFSAGLIGCYRQVPFEKPLAPVEVKVLTRDPPAPGQDEADLIITSHVKRASFLLSPRTADTPYTFVISVNGQEFKDAVKGVEEVESDIKSERGKGVHYLFEKRLRFKPGTYKITLKSEDGMVASVKAELIGGKVYALNFEPLYGRKVGLTGGFGERLLDFRANLDGKEIIKE